PCPPGAGRCRPPVAAIPWMIEYRLAAKYYFMLPAVRWNRARQAGAGATRLSDGPHGFASVSTPGSDQATHCRAGARASRARHDDRGHVARKRFRRAAVAAPEEAQAADQGCDGHPADAAGARHPGIEAVNEPAMPTPDAMTVPPGRVRR